MKIRVAERIYIHDITPAVEEWIKSNLVLNNPDYWKRVRMKKWIGNTEPEIYLYERIGDTFIVPFGCFEHIWKMHPYRADYSMEISPVQRRNYNSSIELYPYQEKAAERLIEAKNGILVMPCGSGKTQVGLEIASRIGGRTLWLTHTSDLYNQSKTRAEVVLDIDGSYGKITAGKVDIGTHITFATVQTMARLDLAKYKNCFDTIIVDECQHCCGTPTRVTQFYKVVSNLSARYKIGLTATPKRADGLHKSMFALLGDIAYEVTKEDVKSTTCPVHVLRIDTDYTPDTDVILGSDGTINYSMLIDDMIGNEHRRAVISDILNGVDGSKMILANRVQYLVDMQKDFKGKSICLSTLGVSKKAKQERKEALRKLNDGEIDAIFATYQLAKEGLDVPNLRYVVFATPEKDETTVIQSAGRVGRKADGKPYGTVIDFIDNFGMYKGWAKKRLGYYKKIDAIVDED